MQFKNTALESEWHNLTPPIRAVVRELDLWLEAQGWYGVLITDAIRTDAEMSHIYGAGWRARGRFSWHLESECRAVDMRNWHWDFWQREQILKWLRAHWPDAEVIMHDIGRGDHLHVAIPAPGSRFKRLRRWIMRRRARAEKET